MNTKNFANIVISKNRCYYLKTNTRLLVQGEMKFTYLNLIRHCNI